MRIFNAEELPTHGGSLRIYGCHAEDNRRHGSAVTKILAEEKHGGLQNLAIYDAFQQRADKVKNNLLAFLIKKKRHGKKVAAYGAAAKGNTLLNYAGIKPDLISYVCDASPSKQGKFMPGSRIPIHPPEMIRKKRPELVLILPWNISNEIMEQLHYIREWGGCFVAAVPELEIFK